MKILAIETATSWQSVAIVEHESVLAREDRHAGGVHGTLLLPAIDRLLAKAGLSLTGLDGLACSIGPGSFTGIRVGVATCLGLRAATGLPLMLVPTLEAMAWNVASRSLPICPVLTSRKGELYWARFRRGQEGHLERCLVEHAGSPRALAQTLTEDTLVVGEGWLAVEPDIRAAALPSVRIVPGHDEEMKPSAVSVAVLGMQRFRRNEIAGGHVAPLYVQQAEAEIKFEQSGGVSPVIRRQERVAAKTAQRLARGRQGRRPGVRSDRSHGA